MPSEGRGCACHMQSGLPFVIWVRFPVTGARDAACLILQGAPMSQMPRSLSPLVTEPELSNKTNEPRRLLLGTCTVVHREACWQRWFPWGLQMEGTTDMWSHSRLTELYSRDESQFGSISHVTYRTYDSSIWFVMSEFIKSVTPKSVCSWADVDMLKLVVLFQKPPAASHHHSPRKSFTVLVKLFHFGYEPV